MFGFNPVMVVLMLELLAARGRQGWAEATLAMHVAAPVSTVPRSDMKQRICVLSEDPEPVSICCSRDDVSAKRMLMMVVHDGAWDGSAWDAWIC